MSSFLDIAATRDDESDTGSDDVERLDGRRGGEKIDDSSEEEEEDDEEEARKIREGFIVEDEDPDRSERRRRKKNRKRKHQDAAGANVAAADTDAQIRSSRLAEDDEDLDEDDLELLIESGGGAERGLKRLKRAQDRDLANIFDEDEELPDEIETAPTTHGRGGEFDDFIEDDLSEDEIDRAQRERQNRSNAHRALNRQDPTAETVGMDEDAYQDALDVFGNGEDYLDALQSDDEEVEAEVDREVVDLNRFFEPNDLQNRMLTDADEIIRMTDEPERMQLARGAYREVQLDEEDFDWLCVWMHRQLYDRCTSRVKDNSRDRNRTDLPLEEPHLKAVKDVLTFYTKEMLEVPYIWNHRREYLEWRDTVSAEAPDDPRETIRLISIDDLWQVVSLEVKFRSIVEKRDALKKTYEALNIQDQIFDSCILNEELNSPQDVLDLHGYLYFRYSAQIRDLQASQSTTTFKKPSSKFSFYEHATKQPIYEMVQAFGISAQQFAENVETNTKRHYAEDPAQHTDDFALTYATSADFSDASAALRYARNIYVQELLHNPVLRKSMRLSYKDIAELTIVPTRRGIKQIDEFHPYYDFKYAQGLPVEELKRAPNMVLQMIKAAEEGLIELKVELQQKDRLLEVFSDFMMSDNVSAIAEEWNAERREICRQMFEEFGPICSSFLLEELRSESEEKIAAECRAHFREKLNQKRVSCATLDDEDVPNVLAMSNGFGGFQEDTVVVCVDEQGRPRQHHKFKDFQALETQQSLRDLIRTQHIDVIGIAGFSPRTTRLKSDVELALSDLDPQHRPQCVYVNDEVARLYQDSPRAKKEYPTLATLQRYCVALAHYLQSPVHEYVALGKDLKQLVWHPQQRLIPEDLLWTSLESAMVDIVNLVGIDINKAQDSVYEENLLQYVSGLGPRKANYLKRRIAQNGGTLASRTELLEKRYITRNIFVNCASVFRIRFSKRRFVEHYGKRDEAGVTQLDVLDETRIHPEDYELANKMAADAQDLDEEDVDALKSSGGPVCVMREKGEFDKLDELILEDYASELFRAFNQPKLITLHMIKRELQKPYEEIRQSFHQLTRDEIFTMLTGESVESFSEGSIVSARIFRISERYLLCKTDSGIELEVPASDMGLPMMDVKPEHHFSVNDAVRGLLVEIDRTTFKGTMSIDSGRVSDALASHRRKILSARGSTRWNEYLEESHQGEAKRAQDAAQRSQRVIKHPLFKQFNAIQAEQYLGAMQRGDAVIRPSSKGPDHIAVTWKVSDGIFQHLDVLELDKDSTHSIGTKLKVGNATYSDLDELIVSHVKAMAKKIDEMAVHEKFQRGSKTDTEQYLTKYSEANPRRSCYAFCFSHKHPGYFDLCFKANPRAEVGDWPVKIVPNAYLMRDNVYADMTSLCNGFKLLFAKDSQQKR